jgi:hypothetical protein
MSAASRRCCLNATRRCGLPISAAP